MVSIIHRTYQQLFLLTRRQLAGETSSGRNHFSSNFVSELTVNTPDRSDQDDSHAHNNVSQRKKRRRHSFKMEEIPTFHQFQAGQQVRSLYRSYLRLLWPSAQRLEFLTQIRREFRQNLIDDGEWQRKRALSDGKKRLKELSAMLGTSFAIRINKQNATDVHNHNNDKMDSLILPSTNPLITVSPQWPWQMKEGKPLPARPMPFPPKTQF